jgi:KaiC/GvpD/RAD55 family RecA-like ATPase
MTDLSYRRGKEELPAQGSPSFIPDWAPPGLERVSTGNTLLDHFLQGGLPRGSACLLLGPPYCGKQLVAAGFALAAARAKEPLVVCLTGMPPMLFRLLVSNVGLGFETHEDEGKVAYVDCYAGMLGEESTDPLVVAAPSPHEPESVLRALSAARAKLGDPAKLNVVVLGLTDLVLRSSAQQTRESHSWLQRLLGQCRRWQATTLMSAEKGVHSEAELSLFRHLADQAIEFMEAEDNRTFLRARGLGGSVTRDWVEYVATEQGLDIVGSFTERKIR